MKRRASSRSAVAWVALFVALRSSVVLASPEAAHEHYQRAIALLRQGELREAKAEFERAFAESPHPSVLYNLARVCLELGELEEARKHGERFLAKAGPETAEQQRSDIRRMLDELSRRKQPAPAVPPPSSQAPPPPRKAATAPRTSPKAPAAIATPCPSCPPPEQVDVMVARERVRAAGIALGATGAALLGTGVIVLIWNEGEARAAERQTKALEARRPSREVRDQQGLLDVLAYERAVSENRAAMRSVERFDVVGWSLLGGGAALLGTGVALVLSHAGEAEPELSLRGTGLSLTARF